MLEVSNEELKIRQLEILDQIDRFCTENDIHYSLAFGTLLGAVRHQGYIPWDDDIDIMMLRDDYKLFIESFGVSGLTLVSSNIFKSYLLPFAKVIDNSTILIEHSAMKMPLGIYVDIFPVDNIPNDPYLCKAFFRRKKWLNYLLDIKILSFSKKRSFWKNILLGAAKSLTFFIDSQRITRWVCQFSQLYNHWSCNRVAVFAPTDNKERWIVDRCIFNEYTRVSFENRMLCVIKDWDCYLTATYGNYMELPPISQRCSHHSFLVFKKD